jgi:hypothetical protein
MYDANVDLQVEEERCCHWAVGDLCRAVFTEDSEVYEARILSLDSENGTCIVRYLGYGNEEEQSLEDLIPTQVTSRKQAQSSSCSDVSMHVLLFVACLWNINRK